MSDSTNSTEDERPPLFKKWSSWYAVLVLTLMALIALFYLLTIGFA